MEIEFGLKLEQMEQMLQEATLGRTMIAAIGGSAGILMAEAEHLTDEQRSRLDELLNQQREKFREQGIE